MGPERHDHKGYLKWIFLPELLDPRRWVVGAKFGCERASSPNPVCLLRQPEAQSGRGGKVKGTLTFVSDDVSHER